MSARHGNERRRVLIGIGGQRGHALPQLLDGSVHLDVAAELLAGVEVHDVQALA